MASSKQLTSVKKVRTNQNSNSEQVVREQIIDTPFMAVKFKNDWYMTVGRLRHPKKFSNKEQVIKYAEKPTWELIEMVIEAYVETLKK